MGQECQRDENSITSEAGTSAETNTKLVGVKLVVKSLITTFEGC